MRRIGVITDNTDLASFFAEELRAQGLPPVAFFCSPKSTTYVDNQPLESINIKNDARGFDYDLLISIHCRQLFPALLVERVRCVNFHPGLNPHNRGWYPQVFSILNGKPAGATLHEMDAEVDHGPIIDQISVDITEADTSGSAYRKIIEAEKVLIRRHIKALISGNFAGTKPTGEGNYNGKLDFAALCRLDMDSTGTLREHMNLLRALTHDDFRNAYFESADGERIYVRLTLFPESMEE